MPYQHVGPRISHPPTQAQNGCVSPIDRHAGTDQRHGNTAKIGNTLALRMACGLLAVVALLPGCAMVSTTPLAPQGPELADHPAVTQPIEPVPLVTTDDNGQTIAKSTPPMSVPPTELAKVSLPDYVVEPPDILLIQAARMVPKPPYYLQTFDVIQIFVPNAFPDQPIAGPFQIDPSGFVNLGGSYDSVKIAGLTMDEAQEAIRRHLGRLIESPQVSVVLLQPSGLQAIAGEHLIGPDCTVNLGIYGRVYVAGMTLSQVREAIEEHLSQFLDDPRISVDVLVYNSKYYYVIIEGAGVQETVLRIPSTGNETVLDAIAQINGLSQLSSKRMWIARPAPQGVGCYQILPIDYMAITRNANPETNYQILPNDRLFVAEDRLMAVNSLVTKITQPVERVFGFSLLGSQAIQFLQRFPRGSFTF